MANEERLHPIIREFAGILRTRPKKEILTYLQENFKAIQRQMNGQEFFGNSANKTLFEKSIQSSHRDPVEKVILSGYIDHLFIYSIPNFHKNFEHIFFLYLDDHEYEMIELLLQRGFNPNRPNIDGIFPLQRALLDKDEQMVRILLGHPYTRVDPAWIETADEHLKERLLEKQRGDYPENRLVYLYKGHGGDQCDPSTGKLLEKPIEEGNIYVASAFCGIVSIVNDIILEEMMADPFDIILKEPLLFKNEIESAISRSDYEAEIVIYHKPSDTYIDNLFTPAEIFEIQNNLRIRNSGILTKPAIQTAPLNSLSSEIYRPFVPGNSKTLPLPLESLNPIFPFYSASIYPTLKDIQTKFKEASESASVPAWNFMNIFNFFRSWDIPISTFMSSHPGIHYNLLCRYPTVTNRSCLSAITLRRTQSIEERGRNIVRTLKHSFMFDNIDTYIDFLVRNHDALRAALTDRNYGVVGEMQTRSSLTGNVNNSTKSIKQNFLQMIQRGKFPIFLLLYFYGASNPKVFIQHVNNYVDFFDPILTPETLDILNRLMRQQTVKEKKDMMALSLYLLNSKLNDPLLKFKFKFIYLHSNGSLLEFLNEHKEELQRIFSLEDFRELVSLPEFNQRIDVSKEEVRQVLFPDLPKFGIENLGNLSALAAAASSPPVPHPALRPTTEGGRRRRPRRKQTKRVKKTKRRATHRIRVKKV
jgi:hypothetical protein